jgi:hypothetical protein
MSPCVFGVGPKNFGLDDFFYTKYLPSPFPFRDSKSLCLHHSGLQVSKEFWREKTCITIRCTTNQAGENKVVASKRAIESWTKRRPNKHFPSYTRKS